MISEELILSIVIPTKNRYSTLIPLIEKLLLFKNNNFEIVVNDNSDEAPPDNLTKYFEDKRLRYFYKNASLSMSENASFAIQEAKGHYICFIGDDDGVTPSAIAFCNWMKKNGIESASFKKGSFIWPDLTRSLNGIKNLRIPFFTSEIRKVNTALNLKRQLGAASQNTYYGPSPYHGIVSRKCYEEVFKKAGTYFPGPTPDMSSSVSISLIAKNHVYVDVPFIISGQSAKSAAGLGAKGQHYGELKDISFLPKDIIEKWFPLLPKYWSSETITAQSALQALYEMGRKDLENDFNYSRLLALCLIYVPTYRARTLKHIIQYSKRKEVNLFYVVFELIKINCQRGLNYTKRKLSSKPKVFNCHDIGDAISFVDKDVRESDVLNKLNSLKLDMK